MRITSMISVAALAAAGALSGSASAATLATATTSVNIRSGPGPQYAIVGVIGTRDRAAMLGCIQDSLWCRVSYRGKTGWTYSKYLTTRVAGRPLVIAQNPASANVPIITYQQAPVATYQPPATTTAVETVGSAVAPETTGTLIESPEPTATETTTQYVVNPPPAVRTYVIRHPAETVYLNGDVAVGAGLPQNVTLQPVPDTEYDYAYVNQTPVLVQPRTRRIVYVYR